MKNLFTISTAKEGYYTIENEKEFICSFCIVLYPSAEAAYIEAQKVAQELNSDFNFKTLSHE